MAAIKVISLGWGVQSWALAAMSALGFLPRVDFAIHSDTGYERSDTYRFAKDWAHFLISYGIQVQTVNGIRHEFDDGNVFMPVFTKRDDQHGQLRRQCTDRWKITPVRRWLRQELDRRKVKPFPGAVEMWMGITMDEFTRMKPSTVKYVRHVYPFVNVAEAEARQLSENIMMPDGKRWNRLDVVNWLQARGLEVPVSSSCVMCPYHRPLAWREVLSHPDDGPRAIEIDERVRDMRPGFKSFVADARVPLAELNTETAEDRGQLSLFEDECSGYCMF